MIKEIAFNAYPSKNVQAAREWYEKMLGLTFTGPYAENGVEMYNEAHVGNGWFSLMTSDWMGREAGTASGVVFEVDDIERTAADLKAKGVAVEDIYDTPVCRITSFADSEGNKISVHQITVPH